MKGNGKTGKVGLNPTGVLKTIGIREMVLVWRELGTCKELESNLQGSVVLA